MSQHVLGKGIGKSIKDIKNQKFKNPSASSAATVTNA